MRNRHGELKALSAVCRHRAMPVVEGRGRTRTFLCPLSSLGLFARRPVDRRAGNGPGLRF
ncbi:MAG TPA: Rieske 2Fe-2S domain-containing protein [Stellaceae bacterium]|nr:Rieske 2Fe-2S domain-containing protein [Stellaceae bacterium]